MGWYKIKLKSSDIFFSKYIRLRDKQCVRCHKKGTGKYGINGLQCSHYFSRRKKSTRYDEQNCDTLCPGCHRSWELDKKGEYRDFKINQLGQKSFDLRELRSNTGDKTIDEKLISTYYRFKISSIIKELKTL